MNLTIVAVGTVKEHFFADAVAEYRKRLQAYATVKVIEIPEAVRPSKASEKATAQALQREAEKIREALPKSGIVIPLCVEGKEQDSLHFSKSLSRWAEEGGAQITFVIGGSDGLDPTIKTLGPKLSFSPMTFPHTLMRVILFEQIYRAFRILHHQPYHK